MTLDEMLECNHTFILRIEIAWISTSPVYLYNWK